MSVDDNGDGTIYVEGGFSNGASAAGIPVIIVKDAPYNGPEETFKGKKSCMRGNLEKIIVLRFQNLQLLNMKCILMQGRGILLEKRSGFDRGGARSMEKAVDAFDFGDWKDYMLEK